MILYLYEYLMFNMYLYMYIIFMFNMYLYLYIVFDICLIMDKVFKIV